MAAQRAEPPSAEAINRDDEPDESFVEEVAKGDGKQFVVFWDFTTGHRRYRWRLRDKSGKTVFFSPRRYESKQECEVDIQHARIEHPSTPVVDLTETL